MAHPVKVQNTEKQHTMSDSQDKQQTAQSVQNRLRDRTSAAQNGKCSPCLRKTATLKNMNMHQDAFQRDKEIEM